MNLKTCVDAALPILRFYRSWYPVLVRCPNYLAAATSSPGRSKANPIAGFGSPERAILGGILAGVAIGPFALVWVSPSDTKLRSYLLTAIDLLRSMKALSNLSV
jgi:hypothetical protein